MEDRGPASVLCRPLRNGGTTKVEFVEVELK